MCGRYSATKKPVALAAEFAAFDATEGRLSIDYNVAPTKIVATVVQRHPRDPDGMVLPDEPTVRSLRAMKWGLVPSWAKDPSVGNKLINTRTETAAEKPSFRKALARQRCLVPADGWYEWQRDGKAKIPFYVTPRDSSSLPLAGIWESWRNPQVNEGAPLITFSILTTDAVGPLAEIHHRMPLLMPQAQWAQWLDPDVAEVPELLMPPSLSEVDELEIRPVSSLVNSVRNNSAELWKREEPVPRELDQDSLFDLSELRESGLGESKVRQSERT